MPVYKISRLKPKLIEVQGAQQVSARKLVSLIGKIVSMSISLGPVTRLIMTRALYATLHHKVAWCQNLALTSEASQDLEF